MSLSTHLFRSLFALPLLVVSLLALTLPQPPAPGPATTLTSRASTSACVESARSPTSLTQVPADLSPRLRRHPPVCRG